MKPLDYFLNDNILKIAKPVKLDATDKSKLRKLKWKDIIVNDPSSTGDIFNMNFNLGIGKDLTDNVVFTFQMRKNNLYKIQSVELAPDLRGLKLSTKLYRSVINDIGHLYSPASSRHNDLQVPSIRKALEKDPGVEVFKNGEDYLFLDKKATNYKEIKKTFTE